MLAAFAFVAYIIFFPGDDGSDALHAKGYPVTLEELDAWYPEPPPGENAGEYYVDAGTLLNKSTYEDLEWIPLFGEVELPPLGTPIPEDMLADIEAFIEHESVAFELIDEASLIETSRYPTFHGPGSIHFLPVIKGVWGQQLRVYLYSGRGEIDRSLDEIAKLTHWANTLSNEPSMSAMFLLSSHVRSSVQAIERFMNDDSLTAEELSKLDALLGQMVRRDAALRGLIGERCTTMNMVSTSRSLLDDYVRVTYADMSNAFITIAEAGLPEALDEYIVLRNAEFSMFQIFEGIFAQGLYGVVDFAYESIARVATVRAAIAIEKLRANGSELPANREAMPESTKAEWPIDPFSGRPLGYKRVDEGYIVYSAGPDFEDNGGDFEEGRDTVFRVLR
jgi:hypothetical protein